MAANSPARPRPSRPAAVAALLACAGLTALAVQPPPEVEDPKAKPPKKIVVEEEDPKGPVKKKIVVDDDPAPGKGAAGTPPDVRLDELVRAADESRVPALRILFAKYAVPFDRLTGPGGAVRVRPLPLRKAEWPAGAEVIGVVPIDAAGKSGDPVPIRIAEVRNVEYFESMVHTEAENLLKRLPDGGTAADGHAAAEKLLAAGLRFHDYARERTIRRGKTWDDVRTPLADRLKNLRLEMLRAAILEKNPARVREVSTRLMDAYPNDAVVTREVAVARVAEAERLVEAGAHEGYVRARELLDEFDRRYPGAGGEAARRVRGQLAVIALKALSRAQEKKKTDRPAAIAELERAAAIDPTIPGIRELERELGTNYPVLYVGVHHYPQNMSPATARLDGERQAVELMFEGLLEEVPEGNGAVGYRPGAALAAAASAPGEREFLLRAFDRDAANRPGFDSHDVVATLKMMQTRADTWAGYPLPWLAGLPDPRDSGTVRVPFALGHPDPRALLTFKLLPTRWLAERGKAADDPVFAAAPFGTGPFRLRSNPKPLGDTPREMVFESNPMYGRWRDRDRLPHLREVRLVEVAKLDPVKAFQADKLHLLPDVPTADLVRFTGPAAGLSDKVAVVTAETNRRVHVLAVNLRRSYLQNKVLRQGVSLAIDREAVLDKVFRAGPKKFHRAMTGPYPPDSWAAGKGPGTPSLGNPNLAFARLKAYLADPTARAELTLWYPDDDPRARAACEAIRDQIHGLFQGVPGGRKVAIDPRGEPTEKLLRRVHDEHDYDLAYVPFDYPDDWHPYALGAALDRQAGGRGGRNWFGFLLRETNPDAEDQELGRLLAELRGYRDVAGQVAPKAAKAGQVFNNCLPFIPLWQLDRHSVVRKSLKVFIDDTETPAGAAVLNPTTLFQGVARWRLE